jgi:predicted RNase H-like nuclease
MVVLFGLERILPYKAKRRRSFKVRHEAMCTLVDRIEGLATTDVTPWHPATDPWRQIRHQVQHATTSATLRRLEDRLDAVVCAYIAAYGHAWPDRVHVFGDACNGYILTPITPDIAETLASTADLVS